MKAVGFDQKILLHQLDFTAKKMKSASRLEMYELLDGFLREDVAGAVSRKHVATILMKTWYLTEEVELRDEALAMLPELSHEEKLLVHWLMVLLAYPFFKDIVRELSRLFKNQEVVSMSTLKKRMKEIYGDRTRVDVAISSSVRSLKNWGVLISEKANQLYLPEKLPIENLKLQALMVKAMLKTLEVDCVSMNSLTQHGLLFPFQYEFDMLGLRATPGLKFHKQGVDDLVVEAVTP